MEIFVKNVKGLTLPKQAYTSDSGIDVTCTSDAIIKGEFVETASMGKIWKTISYLEYKTSLFVTPNPEYGDFHIEL